MTLLLVKVLAVHTVFEHFVGLQLGVAGVKEESELQFRKNDPKKKWEN